ncbi:MAG: hypothetical protein QXH63_05380 [Pyrobaculum sp.]|jgi:hypothetical protein
MTSKRRGGIQLSAYPFINFDIVLDVEFIFQQEIDEDVLNQLKSLIYTLGPPPIDIVIVGSEETKLEIEDVVVLKISTPLDRRRILKEVATAHAVADPQLIDIWGTPPDIVDPLALELSIALFKRLVDTLVAKVDYKLVLERDYLEVIEGETVAYTLVRTFAEDISISLAMANHTEKSLRLLTTISTHPIYPLYRRLWDFAVSNFKFLPIYNWLQLIQ